MNSLAICISALLCHLAVAAGAAPAQHTPAGQRLRVACVGNSVTYGYGLPDREHTAYPVRLQQLLGDGYEVANFGHSGATLLARGHCPYTATPEYRRAVDFGADVIVVHLGLNDTDPRNWPDWKEDFVGDYRALIDSLRQRNPDARVLLCRMTPIFERHPRFKSGTRDWHAQIQQAIERTARGAGAQLVDLYSPLHVRPDLFPDALHPNAEGAMIIARTVCAAITGDYGGLSLPVTYTDHMVLQRDMPLRVAGRGNARQTVSLRLLTADGAGEETYTATADASGEWSIVMPAHEAAEGYTLTVATTDSTVTLRDVAFGDVWLASGQSNMELRVDQVLSAADDVDASARLPRLRLFNMPARARTDAVEWDDSTLLYTNELHNVRIDTWQNASPSTVPPFSAVAFAFGRVLCDSLAGVPIGIICNAVGGSTTESWVDRTTLEQEMPDVLTAWMTSDYGQPWARGRARQNVARALRQDSPVYNPLQRHPYDPACLYETAIAPLAGTALSGVIWYQGESNTHNIELHERLFTLLEESWRSTFACRQQGMTGIPSAADSQGTLPFYFVQLSSLNRPSWPAFRDSQRRLAARLPSTWMAVTTDLGDPADVHYTNKRPVGERLALLALAHTYGHAGIVAHGPSVVNARLARRSDGHDAVAGHDVVLTVTDAEGLRATRGFEVAGAEGLFVEAQPQLLRGGQLLLRVPSAVAVPACVRYAWRGYTDADMHNAAGLPASNFIMEVGTDD